MPTYQYACTQCDERLEAVQSFSDAALTECPACDGRLRKVFSAVGVVFKGSGFYKTDSRSGATGEKVDKGEKADKPAADKGDDKGSGDKGSGDKGSGDKGRGDKGKSDKGAAAAKAPAAASSSSTSAPAAKSA